MVPAQLTSSGRMVTYVLSILYRGVKCPGGGGGGGWYSDIFIHTKARTNLGVQKFGISIFFGFYQKKK